MSALYSIYISADSPKGIGDDQQAGAEKELACQVGVCDPKREPCLTPPLWKFHWALSSDGRTVQGDSDETIGVGRINSVTGIERELGEFRTEAGHRYKFDLDVLFDNRDVRIANPRLMVCVSDFHAESSQVLSGLLRLICLPVGATGAFLVLAPLGLQWRKQRRAHITLVS